MKKIFILSILLFLLLPSSPLAEEHSIITINSPSAILINTNTGEIIFEKESDKKIDAASLTKIMTLVIANEELQQGNLNTDDMINISTKAWKTGGSRMFLEVGTKYTALEIMKGIAVVSGNDAAVAIAEHIEGDTVEFVKRMNDKAREIGMDNTRFYSVNGLGTNGNYDTSTAKDLGILTHYYMTNFPEHLTIHKLNEYTTETKSHPIKQQNRNPLLDSYLGANGLKTGMINGNYNLIATAERDHIGMIAIIMGAKDSSERANDARKILDYGFSQFKSFIKGTKGEIIDTIPVYKAKGLTETDIVLESDIIFITNIKDIEEMTVEDKLNKEYISGAAKKGDIIGKRIVNVGEKTFESNIIINQDIEKGNWLKVLGDTVFMFLKWLINMIFG